MFIIILFTNVQKNQPVEKARGNFCKCAGNEHYLPTG